MTGEARVLRMGGGQKATSIFDNCCSLVFRRDAINDASNSSCKTIWKSPSWWRPHNLHEDFKYMA